MARIGVVCKSCKQGIDLGEHWGPGPKKVEWGNPAWKKTIPCPNPECKKTHEYSGTDLVKKHED